MTEHQFAVITRWQDRTFPKATALSKIHHLKEEIEELLIDITNDSPVKHLEFADCILLLFGAASKSGLDYSDICDAIDSKMKINYMRNWGTPDENGVVKHLELQQQKPQEEIK